MGNKRMKNDTKNKTKKKLVLVFDEKARRDFLTGFRKRKLQRKTKAAEQLQEKLKLERKKIQAQTKLMYKKLVQSQKPVPEVSHLISENINMDDHVVSVTEMSASEIAKENSWIGENQVCYNVEKNEEIEDQVNKSSKNTVIGMEVGFNKKSASKLDLTKLKTEKDFKKAVKLEAANHVKKSKVFKTKSKKAQIKNSKKKMREERRKYKLSKREKKTKNKH